MDNVQNCDSYNSVPLPHTYRSYSLLQLENGVLLPSLRPMLPLLDLHGVRRLDFHTSVLEVCTGCLNRICYG
jgi:hypothetical protein